MDRHVIKGRGKNRGLYLCWARQAPELEATADGFVWLPVQRNAVRWKDPEYNRGTWATDRARLHDGYFVKLVTSKAITTQVPELRAFIYEHAARASKKLPCHWFDGDFHDASANYCWDCATKVVDEKYAEDPKRFEELYEACDDEEERHVAAIDGGGDTDHDSPPYCEKCGARLSGHLTEHGSDSELSALTSDAAPCFDDANGWDDFETAVMNLSDTDPRWKKIAKVVSAARAEEAKAVAAQEVLSRSPGMVEARRALVGLLQARKEQKAPDPSFPLWSELLAWRAVPYEVRRDSKEQKAREDRMVTEAKRFANCLGFRSYWQGGMFIIEAPYGAYYWPFVVEIEQYRLWKPPAFEQGRAQNPRDRDANPYPEGDEQHLQWDCGYMSTFTRPARTKGGAA